MGLQHKIKQRYTFFQSRCLLNGSNDGACRHGNVAVICGFLPQQHFEQRAFTAAVYANETHMIPGCYFKGNAGKKRSHHKFFF